MELLHSGLHIGRRQRDASLSHLNQTPPQPPVISKKPKNKKNIVVWLSPQKKKSTVKSQRAVVITFKALTVQGRKGNDWSGKLNLQEPLCTQRPSQGHFLLGGLRAPFLLMEGKQNRWDTNCTFIHLKVQGNFPSAPVKFSDCLSIL